MAIRRAFIQMSLSHQVKLVFMLVGMAVLGRVLTPEAFGLFATALAFLVVAESLVDYGLSSFLIREKQIEQSDFASATGLSMALAMAVFALAYTAIFLVPRSYWDEDLRALVGILAFCLLAKPVIMPFEAMLQRELQFGLLSVAAVLRTFMQTAVAIILALGGFGPLALAAGLLADYLLGASILVMMSAPDHRFVPSVRGWGRFVRFGAQFSAASLLPNIGNAVLLLILRVFLGVAAVGLYNRAQTIVQLLSRTVLDGIASVVLPAISRSLDGGEAAERIYFTKTGYLGALCWPFFLVTAILAEPLVMTLLGSQWSAAVPAVQYLAILGVSLPFTKMSMKLFVALDMTRSFLRITAIHQTARLTFAAAGAMISLEAACLGISLAHLIKALLLSHAVKKAVPYKMADLLGLMARCGGIALVAAIGPALVMIYGDAWAQPLRLAAGGGLAGLGWTLGLVVTRHPLLGELNRLRRQRVSGKGANVSALGP